MHICQSLDNTITNAKCISPSDICSIKTAYMSNAYIQYCIRLIARSQLQSMYCGMWWWLYIPSWGYHAILLQSSIYFCNKIYAISGYDWIGMTSSYSNDIPSRFLANIWGNQWCNHSHCDNCCVYHTSISIISIDPIPWDPTWYMVVDYLLILPKLIVVYHLVCSSNILVL